MRSSFRLLRELPKIRVLKSKIKMKRVVFNVLAGALVAAALTACGGGRGSSGSGKFDRISGVIDAKYIRIGVSFDQQRYGAREIYYGENIFSVTVEATNGAFSLALPEPRAIQMVDAEWFLYNLPSYEVFL